MKNTSKLLSGLAVFALASSAFSQNYPNGNPGDWDPSSPAPVTVNTGGPNGNGYTTIYNTDDAYQAPGYGSGPYTWFNQAPDGNPTYNGAFQQSVEIYINTTWAPAAAATGGPTSPTAFWLDMTPYHSDPNNYGAEHNFRFGATGSDVNVSVDGQSSLLYSITSSGWYDFQITWQKGATGTDPVISDMNILAANGSLLATTQVLATSPGGPFDSSDLEGSGYMWFPVWQNGFAGDSLEVANVDTRLLTSVPEPTTIISGALMLLPIGASTLRILRKKQTT